MSTIELLANYAEIIGAAAVVFAIVVPATALSASRECLAGNDAILAGRGMCDRWALHFRENYNPRAFEWHEWLAAKLESMPDPVVPR